MAPKYAEWKKSGESSIYLRFEWFALACLMIMLAAITVYAIAMTAVALAGDLINGEALFEAATLKETFGRILTILIVIEFSHSVHVAMTKHVGALQAKILVLITILVIVRKLILMDLATLDARLILALGGLLLALGGLYWLISFGDRFEGSIESEEHIGKLTQDPQMDQRAGHSGMGEKIN